MYKSSRPLANVLVGLLVLSAVFDLITGYWCIHGVSVMNAFVGGEASMTEINAYDTTAAKLASGYLYFFAVCVIMACIWIHRSAKNTAVLSDHVFMTTPGWAVGWYFVPYANLYKPQQVMRQMFDYARPGHSGALISIWWGLWLLGGFLGWADMRLMLEVDSPDSFLVSTKFSAFVSCVSFVSSLAFMKVVLELTGAQDEAMSARIQEERAHIAQPAVPPAF